MLDSLDQTAEEIRENYGSSVVFDSSTEGRKTLRRQQAVTPAVESTLSKRMAPPASAPDADTPRPSQEVTPDDITEMTRPLAEQVAGDPVSPVRDDVWNPTVLDRLAWWLGGEPGEDPTGNLWKATRNSAARAIYQGQNFMPFGEVGAARKAAELSDQLTTDLERLNKGEKPREVFPNALDPDWAADQLKTHYTLWKAQLDEEMKHRGSTIAHYMRSAAIFPEGRESEAFHNAEGFGASFSAFFFGGNFLANMANLALPSMVQFAPAAASLGATIAGPGKFLKLPLLAQRILGAIGMGTISFNADSDASYLEYMTQSGVNGYDPVAVARYLSSPEGKANGIKANQHALPVAGLDALTFGLAGIRAPRALPLVMGERMPVMARAYKSIAGGIYRNEIFNFALQSQIQGLGGAFGEAAGQINAEGKVTSWSDVVAEYAGEFLTTPIEMLSAAKAARNQAGFERVKAQATQDALRELNAQAQSPEAQADPEGFVAHLAQTSQDSPEGVKISIAVSSMKQEEVQQLKAYIPDLSARIDSAVATGSDLEVPLTTYAQATVKNPDAAELIVPYASTTSSVVSAKEADDIVARMEQDTTEYVKNLAMDDEARTDFQIGMSDVAKAINEAIDQGFEATEVIDKDGQPVEKVKERAQRLAVAEIVKNHVANMALETGMSPMEVWNKFGFNVLSEERGDVVKNPDGTIGAVSEKAKGVLKSAAQSFKSIKFDANSPIVPEMNEATKANLERGLRAMDSFLENPRDIPDFMERDGVKINLRLGYEGNPRLKKRGERSQAKGVKHVLEKRWREQGFEEDEIREFLYAIVHTIALGRWEPVTDRTQTRSYRLAYGGFDCVVNIAADSQTDGKAFVVTAFDVENRADEAGANKKSSTNDDPNALVYSAKAPGWLPEPEGATHEASSTPSATVGALMKDRVTILGIVVTSSQALHDLAAARLISKERRARLKALGTLKQDNLGEFIPSSKTIIRWANANRSTLLHETGHWFLDTRIRLAMGLKQSSQPLNTAQQRFVDLTEKAVKWASGKSLEEFSQLSTEEQTKAHEKFARTYEAYLMKGQAPTSALAEVFARFSAFLKQVYLAITSIPEAVLNPESEALFDQLFTAGEQVREAEIRRDLFLHIQDKDSQQKVDSVTRESEALTPQKRTDATTQELFKRRSENYHKMIGLKDTFKRKMEIYAESLRAQYRRQIKERIAESPEMRTLSFFRKQDPETHKTPRLSVKELQALGIPEEEIKTLTEKKIASTRPSAQIPAEALAQELGFSSASEMCTKVSSYTPPTNEEIDAMVQERLEAEHPEVSNSETLAESADIALFNTVASSAALSELNWLNKQVGGDVVTQGFFDVIADGMLESIPVSDLRITARNARKAASRAAAVARKELGSTPVGKEGPQANLRNAVIAKRQEMLQITLARKAQELHDRFDKTETRFHKLFNGEKGSKSKSIPGAYLSIIQFVLLRTGVIENGNVEDLMRPNADGSIAWASFFDNAPEGSALNDPAVAEARGVVEQIIYDRRPAGELSVHDLRTLYGFVESLMAIGRREQQVEHDGKLYERSVAEDEIVSQIVRTKPKVVEELEKTWGDTRVSEMLVSMWRRIDAEHARIQDLFDRMCGTRFGALFKWIGAKMDAAKNRQAEMRRKMCAQLTEAFKPLRPMFNDHTKRYYEELQCSLTDTQIVAIALNLGNDTNIQRLLTGSTKYSGLGNITEAWTVEGIKAVIAQRMTAEQIKAIQNVWDLCSSLQEQRFALELRMGNHIARRVVPNPISFQSSDGQVVELKGGYYPIQYDSNLSGRESTKDVARQGLKVFQNVFGHPTTKRSRLKARSKEGSGDPIALTLEAAFNGLDESIHDICWREALAEADALFAPGSRVYMAIKKHWGRQYTTVIRQWLDDIANDGRNVHFTGDWIMRALRQNVSLAALGFNPVTALIQPIGYVQTVALLGNKWALAGLAKTISNPGAAYRFAMESSALMRDRMYSQFRELTEVQHDLTGSMLSETRTKMVRYAYSPVAAAQMLVDVPTWTGAYARAIAAGCTHEEAVARADRDLVTAQGSGSLEDLSGLERAGEGWKLLTVFYTFFNSAYNLARLTGATTHGMAKAYRLFMLIVAQSVLEQCLRQALDISAGADFDEDDFWKKIGIAPVEFSLNMLVGLREFATIPSTLAGMDTFGYSGPSGFKVVTDTYKLATQIGQGKLDDGLYKAAASVFGDYTGLPMIEIVRAIDAYSNEGDFWAYLFGYKGKR